MNPTGTSPGVPVFPSDTSKPTRKDIKMKTKTLIKYTAAVALTGAIALAAATPGEARNGRNAAAIGFGVGAIAGAAIAMANLPMLIRRATCTTLTATTITLTRRHRDISIIQDGRMSTAPTTSR